MSNPKTARCFEKTAAGKNAWSYVPKDATDVAKTFARIKRQQKEAAEADKALHAENVKQLRKRGQ